MRLEPTASLCLTPVRIQKLFPTSIFVRCFVDMRTYGLTNKLFNDLLDPRIPTTDLRLIIAGEHFQQSDQA